MKKLILLILFPVIISGCALTSSETSKLNSNGNLAAEDNIIIPAGEMEDWQVYKNEKSILEFKYPGSWKVVDRLSSSEAGPNMKEFLAVVPKGHNNELILPDVYVEIIIFNDTFKARSSRWELGYPNAQEGVGAISGLKGVVYSAKYNGGQRKRYWADIDSSRLLELEQFVNQDSSNIALDTQMVQQLIDSIKITN